MEGNSSKPENGRETGVKRRKQEKREGKQERWGSRDKRGRVGRRDKREK
jgi:hypothetical protein